MYEENTNKEKRIAFLSVFSSLCRTGQIDTKTATDIVDSLFIKYPIEETNLPSQNYNGGFGGKKFMNQPKQKPQRCPKCGRMTLYTNKGISAKSGAPYENVKCSDKDGCGFIEWKTLSYEQYRLKDLELKNMGQQHQYDIVEEEEFNQNNNRVPSEYGG